MRSPALGSLELAALLAVSRLGEEAYGLAVREELVQQRGREYSVGAVYTTLQRLLDKGLLAARASEPLPVRGGRSRRHFRLTGTGARAIATARQQAQSMWPGIAGGRRPESA